MTTARETILNGPQGKVTSNGKYPFLRTLFNNFCRYARSNWSYAANSPIADYETLLSSMSGVPHTMDCSAMAGAFALMVKEDLDISNASVVSVSAPRGFATPANSRCFDFKVVGNIRTASQDFARVGRCVFGTHVFVQTQMGFYDPSLTATYHEKNEVKSWLLASAAWKKGVTNPYDGVLFRIESDPSKLLINIDPVWKAPPPGFQDSFLLIDTQDLNKKDYKVAFGTSKPLRYWKKSTKSVSEMLQAIGIQHTFNV